MRKATKSLLLVSLIVGFVLAGLFLLIGVIFAAVAGNNEALFNFIVDSGATGVTRENVQAYQPAVIAISVTFFIMAIFALVSAILSTVMRKELIKGTTKAAMRAKAILLIVFGALSFELPIVPAVFMLAMNECNFKE